MTLLWLDTDIIVGICCAATYYKPPTYRGGCRTALSKFGFIPSRDACGRCSLQDRLLCGVFEISCHQGSATVIDFRPCERGYSGLGALCFV